jgi:uncharacterized repeat protein (TIGR01451 family)
MRISAVRVPHRSRRLRVLSPVVAIGLLLTGVPVVAEVTLTTEVQRVVEAQPGSGAATLEAVTDVLPGDVIRYSIVFRNDSAQDVAAGSVVITNPLPDGTDYVDGSATGDSTRITFSVDGETFEDPSTLTVTDAAGTRRATAADYRSIRWAYAPRLPAGASGEVSFDVRMR